MTAELRWTVALEAALCFSFPTWWLAVDRAWPGGDAYRFTWAVLGGASTAMLLCHVAPAMCATAIPALFRTKPGRIVRWPAGASYCFAAATWLLQLARTSGGISVRWQNIYYPNEFLWRAVAIVVALIWIVVSLLGFRLHRPLTAFCLAVGIAVTSASLIVQAAGLRTMNPHVISEGLDNPLSIAKGMLIAAAPASFLALKIGRIRPSRKTIWWTGVCGIWAPLAASVTVMSLAKMAGARLYWRPSLPIEFTAAIGWLLQGTATRWLIALTVVAPCLIYGIWIRDLTKLLNARWHKLAAYAAIGIAAFKLAEPDLWSGYYLVWLWSVVVASVVLCLASLAPRCYHKPNGDPAPQSSPRLP